VRVLIRGKVWILSYSEDLPKEVDGDCDAPWVKGKQIRIRKELQNQPLLDAYVHEVTHAAFWDLGEGPVASLANVVALDLWEAGLRPNSKTTKVTRDRLEHRIIGVVWTRGEVAVIDESVRREMAESIARVLNRLGWAFK
jgi:hypothetical protein